MRIDCPYCGERDTSEFAYLGDASLRRPDMASASLEAVADYVYLRDNPAGSFREFWYHASGCRSWLIVTRDTRNHAISAVEAAKPAILAEREQAR